MKKLLTILLTFIVLTNFVKAQIQTDAEYVNSLIGKGINGQGIMSGVQGTPVANWPDAYYQEIADGGFESVRIVVEPGQTLYAISNSALAVLKTIVDKCISYGLFPVIDYHITPLWYDNYTSAQGLIFVDNWGKIADYFKSYAYDDLVLELSNEPNSGLNNYVTSNVWNNLVASAVAKIRTYDADRVIMVSPLFYANMQGLRTLVLPSDNNLILSIHYYIPGWMYLQNCPWSGTLNGEGYAGMTWRNIQPFVDNLDQDFQMVRDYQDDNNDIPINIGEWGTVIYADTANRRLYYTMLSNWFSDQGFSHNVWEYDRYFGIMENRSHTGYGSTVRDWFPGFPEAITSDPLVLYDYDSTDLVVGNFSSTTGWSTAESGTGDISIAASGGELVITVANGGSGYQSAILYTPTLDMYADSIYRISYHIRTGSGTKTFAHKETGWNTWYYTYDLPNTSTEVVQTIVRDSTNMATRYEFVLGGSTGTLYLEDFRIEKITPKATPVTTPVDTCQYHITVYDTTTTADSAVWYFDNNLTAAYGDYSLNATGTAEYTYGWACQGTYQLHENTARLYTSSAVNLTDSFRIRICYGTFTTSAWKTIAANKAQSGSGWMLQRGDLGRLVFITENSSGQRDSSFSTNGSVGTIYDQDNYDVQVIVSKTGGYASILVDGVYVTAADSSIRTDFTTNAAVNIYDDAGGGSKAYSYLDYLRLYWYGQAITSRDSCVMIGDTIQIADTVKAEDLRICGRRPDIDCIRSYSLAIGDSIQGLTIQEYIGFVNVNFGTGGADRVQCAFVCSSGVLGNKFELREGSETGTLLATFSNPYLNAYYAVYQTREIAALTGLHDLYIIASDLESPETLQFGWLYFYKQPAITGEDQYRYCPNLT